MSTTVGLSAAQARKSVRHSTVESTNSNTNCVNQGKNTAKPKKLATCRSYKQLREVHSDTATADLGLIGKWGEEPLPRRIGDGVAHVHARSPRPPPAPTANGAASSSIAGIASLSCLDAKLGAVAGDTGTVRPLLVRNRRLPNPAAAVIDVGFAVRVAVVVTVVPAALAVVVAARIASSMMFWLGRWRLLGLCLSKRRS